MILQFHIENTEVILDWYCGYIPYPFSKESHAVYEYMFSWIREKVWNYRYSTMFMNNYTTIRNKCSNFVHKIQYKGMKGKRYSNSFTSSGMVKEEGRAAYYKLLESVRDGDTIRIKRGVYATAEQLADTMIDVEAIVPGGVLCLFSAWNVYRLTTSLPQAYHIAVKRGRKITLPDFPKVELHHITDTMFDIGVKEQNVSGYRIQIYNKERCVCDAVKYRNKVGMDVCAEVVNSYLELPDRNISLLFDYADKLRVRRILEQYIALKL